MGHQSGLGAVIGDQIRRRREQRGMTGAELARRAGLSKATLSGLESGNGNPTVDTLDAIAQALAVPLADILAMPPGAVTTRLAATAPSGEPVQRELLQRIPAGRQVETWRLRLTAEAVFDGVPHAAGTREQIIVSRGRLHAGPPDDLQSLAPGDLLAFDGSVPHRYHAGDEGVDAVVILTSPPTF